jgi:hypothetical protein
MRSAVTTDFETYLCLYSYNKKARETDFHSCQQRKILTHLQVIL